MVNVEVELSAQMTDVHTGATVWANSASDVESVAQRSVLAVASETNHSMDRTIEELLSSVPTRAPQQSR